PVGVRRAVEAAVDRDVNGATASRNDPHPWMLPFHHGHEVRRRHSAVRRQPYLAGGVVARTAKWCDHDTDDQAHEPEEHDDHGPPEHGLNVLRYDGNARLHSMCAYALDVEASLEPEPSLAERNPNAAHISSGEVAQDTSGAAGGHRHN